MIKMKNTQKAYIAGMIDGEGYVGLTRDNKNGRYRPRVVISNCNLPLLEHIQTIIGGRLHKKSRSDRQYQGYNLAIRHFTEWLPQIVPYLVGKKNKAILLLEALEILAVRKKRTSASGNYGLQRLAEIDSILRQKEWLVYL